MDADPIRRNYEITQAYADISRDVRDALGLQHANWCTFATWASATAGDFIRCDMFPRFLLGNLSDNAHLSHKLAALMARSVPGRLRPRRHAWEIVRAVAEGVATEIAVGNLKVFRELAPEFVELCALYRGPTRPSPLGVRAHFEKRLAPGPSQLDGQTRLLEAFDAYARAANSEGPKRAQLTLHASVLVGFHEQIRLQPAIQRGLDVPFDRAIEEVVELIAAWGVVPRLRRRVERELLRLLRGPLSGYRRRACLLYREAVTRAAMQLRMPGRPLDLSHDVPCPRGGPEPDVSVGAILAHTPELAMVMEGLGMLQEGTAESGARDWTRMTDRMPYILELFRATQHDGALFDEPLTARERGAIARGHTPTDQDRLAAA